MPAPSIADPQSATDAGEPQRRDTPKRKSPNSIFFVVALVVGVLISLVVLLVVAGAFIRGGSSSSETGGLPQRVVLEQVEGAPDVDLVLPVEVRQLSGADEIFSDAGGSPMVEDAVVVAGSPELLAIVNSEIGGSEIYRWTEFAANSKEPGPYQCIGVIGYVGSSECNSDTTTNVSLSSGETNGKGETVRYISAFHLPKDAAWIIVESNDGYRVAAEVVDGAGYLQWIATSAQASKPSAVSALDVNLDEVWSAPAP